MLALRFLLALHEATRTNEACVNGSFWLFGGIDSEARLLMGCGSYLCRYGLLILTARKYEGHALFCFAECCCPRSVFPPSVARITHPHARVLIPPPLPALFLPDCLSLSVSSNPFSPPPALGLALFLFLCLASLRDAGLSEMFDLRTAGLPHFVYQRREFAAKAAALSKSFLEPSHESE